MLGNLRNIFRRHIGIKSVKPSPDSEAIFQLSYKDLMVGTLSLQDGKWTFKYTDAFKAQNRIKPLVDFPDKSKLYSAEVLWPFFLSRIPGLGQPSVREVMQNDRISEGDEVALLKRFGRKTIANPYLLEAQVA